MCLVSKPKVAPITPAPPLPPPPSQTAGEVAPSAARRPAADLAAKRKGIRALMIERPTSGLNSSAPGAGLRL